jgi:hypothetical protein
MNVEVLALDAGNYEVHRLHREDRACWVEKNCYVDVWIEVLHALGLEPAAMLAFTVGLEFEGDQWTFFKPSHHMLSQLYGIEVFELNLWRGDILAHALHHVREGKLVFTEVDAYWLPDAQATDYRRQHTKSTIVINALDTGHRQLGYFHNAGYHILGNEDFAQLFRLGQPYDPAFLPLFAEFARIDRIERLPQRELVQGSLGFLRWHLRRLPELNPVQRFASHFPTDVGWLQHEGLQLYHAYAFATLRQLGSAFELAAMYLEWLAGNGERGLDSARAAFLRISQAAKTLVLKTARAVSARKSENFGPVLEEMAEAWDAGTQGLRARYL